MISQQVSLLQRPKSASYQEKFATAVVCRLCRTPGHAVTSCPWGRANADARTQWTQLIDQFESYYHFREPDDAASDRDSVHLSAPTTNLRPEWQQHQRQAAASEPEGEYHDV